MGSWKKRKISQKLSVKNNAKSYSFKIKEQKLNVAYVWLIYRMLPFFLNTLVVISFIAVIFKQARKPNKLQNNSAFSWAARQNSK